MGLEFEFADARKPPPELSMPRPCVISSRIADVEPFPASTMANHMPRWTDRNDRSTPISALRQHRLDRQHWSVAASNRETGKVVRDASGLPAMSRSRLWDCGALGPKVPHRSLYPRFNADWRSLKCRFRAFREGYCRSTLEVTGSLTEVQRLHAVSCISISPKPWCLSQPPCRPEGSASCKRLIFNKSGSEVHGKALE